LNRIARSLTIGSAALVVLAWQAPAHAKIETSQRKVVTVFNSKTNIFNRVFEGAFASQERLDFQYSDKACDGPFESCMGEFVKMFEDAAGDIAAGRTPRDGHIGQKIISGQELDRVLKSSYVIVPEWTFDDFQVGKLDKLASDKGRLTEVFAPFTFHARLQTTVFQPEFDPSDKQHPLKGFDHPRKFTSNQDIYINLNAHYAQSAGTKEVEKFFGDLASAVKDKGLEGLGDFMAVDQNDLADRARAVKLQEALVAKKFESARRTQIMRKILADGGADLDAFQDALRSYLFLYGKKTAVNGEGKAVFTMSGAEEAELGRVEPIYYKGLGLLAGKSEEGVRADHAEALALNAKLGKMKTDDPEYSKTAIAAMDARTKAMRMDRIDAEMKAGLETLPEQDEFDKLNGQSDLTSKEMARLLAIQPIVDRAGRQSPAAQIFDSMTARMDFDWVMGDITRLAEFNFLGLKNPVQPGIFPDAIKQLKSLPDFQIMGPVKAVEKGTDQATLKIGGGSGVELDSWYKVTAPASSKAQEAVRGYYRVRGITDSQSIAEPIIVNASAQALDQAVEIPMLGVTSHIMPGVFVPFISGVGLGFGGAVRTEFDVAQTLYEATNHSVEVPDLYTAVDLGFYTPFILDIQGGLFYRKYFRQVSVHGGVLAGILGGGFGGGAEVGAEYHLSPELGLRASATVLSVGLVPSLGVAYGF